MKCKIPLGCCLSPALPIHHKMFWAYWSEGDSLVIWEFRVPNKLPR
jgi:hypothetical protein